MKTRKQDWFETERIRPIYGIQVLHEGKWLNAINKDGPMLFEDERERDKARDDITEEA